ncbi:MAG: DUF2752 domain-containing protein [Micropruina sp.]
MSDTRWPALSQASAFDPRVALRRVGGFFLAGTALSGLAATTGWGVPCPWRSLTGTLCPFCGATTLGVRLLHLDPIGAFWANPFVFVALAVLALLVIAWVVELLGGPAVRPPPRLRASNDQWYAALGVLGVTFAVLRNLS